MVFSFEFRSSRWVPTKVVTLQKYPLKGCPVGLRLPPNPRHKFSPFKKGIQLGHQVVQVLFRLGQLLCQLHQLLFWE